MLAIIEPFGARLGRPEEMAGAILSTVSVGAQQRGENGIVPCIMLYYCCSDAKCVSRIPHAAPHCFEWPMPQASLLLVVLSLYWDEVLKGLFFARYLIKPLWHLRGRGVPNTKDNLQHRPHEAAGGAQSRLFFLSFYMDHERVEGFLLSFFFLVGILGTTWVPTGSTLIALFPLWGQNTWKKQYIRLFFSPVKPERRFNMGLDRVILRYYNLWFGCVFSLGYSLAPE